MVKRMAQIGLLALFLVGCGGPDLCACEEEAKKDDPDVEMMQECEKLYEGKDFEEIEAELRDCA